MKFKEFLRKQVNESTFDASIVKYVKTAIPDATQSEVNLLSFIKQELPDVEILYTGADKNTLIRNGKYGVVIDGSGTHIKIRGKQVVGIINGKNEMNQILSHLRQK